MSRRLMSRTVVAAFAAGCFGIILTPGAQAADRHERPGEACASPAFPFRGLRLDGLAAEKHLNWPGGPCPVYVWVLRLDDARRQESYSGGEFFLYDPLAAGTFGGFINGDILVQAVTSPERVTFMSIAPQGRTEVRFGDPGRPHLARVVAAATPCQ